MPAKLLEAGAGAAGAVGGFDHGDRDSTNPRRKLQTGLQTGTTLPAHSSKGLSMGYHSLCVFQQSDDLDASNSVCAHIK